MKRLQFPLICLLALLLFASIPQARTPLVQDGKKSVFQRVITHPGAQLFTGPDQGAPVLRPSVKTFTAMYIYDRQGDRFEVGVSSSRADGWINAKDVTVWPQAITMLFTDRTGRAPVLFFRDHAAIDATCRAPSVKQTIAQYTAQLNGKAALPPDFPVVASEPQKTAVAEKNFYLLPVLNIDNQYSPLNLLEVASINPGISPAAQTPPAQLRAGFAFVIDTTISMKPYIDQTLSLIRSLYDQLEKSPYKDNMAFAVVAFRSDTRHNSQIGYTAKVICDFKTVAQRKELETALASVEEATVSTHAFNEDSFAGIKEAVDHLNWKDFGARIMMMISDAGPLGAGDPHSSTGMSPKALADYLRSHKIYLTALHVKSPSGRKNHAYAAQNYMELTRQSDNRASYIPLDATTPSKGAEAFDKTGRVLANSYAAILMATAEKKLPGAKQLQNNSSTPEDEARRIAETTGYAMRLQFLGNQQKSMAPQVVRAWIADADLEKMEENAGAPILAAEPAVLLTKGQLSNLYRQLKLLLKSSEEAFLSGQDDLFGMLRSAAAQMSRDPQQFSLRPDQNLAQNGLLDEVLEGLPYKSTISSMTQHDWEAMSTGERDTFIRHIKGLLARYEAYDKDAANWESFGSPNPNDWVYRVPLGMLP